MGVQVRKGARNSMVVGKEDGGGPYDPPNHKKQCSTHDSERVTRLEEAHIFAHLDV